SKRDWSSDVCSSDLVESHIYEQRLTVLDLASGAIRQLTPPDLYVYEYDWSPDSKQLVATAAPGNGDDNWYVAELYTISVGTGERSEERRVGKECRSG